MYAKDFGQNVVITQNKSRQTQTGNSGVIKSQSFESYESQADRDYEIIAKTGIGKIQFRFSKDGIATINRDVWKKYS